MADSRNPSPSDTPPTDRSADDSTTLPHAAADGAQAGPRRTAARVPQRFGRYEIVLRVDDSSIRTRRLDLFFYVREITVDEV
jgi:hypothetical protein